MSLSNPYVRLSLASFILFGLALPMQVYAQAADQDGPIATHGKRITQQILPTPIILDAPKPDYERVAWCHGALTGHMEIARTSQEDDEVMTTIGRNYLKTYEAALTLYTATLADETEINTAKSRAERARKKGLNGWDAVRAAVIDKQKGAYLNWSLPGDCERAAVTISGHPNLFAEMQDEHESKVIAETLKPVNERGRVTIAPTSAVKPAAKPEPVKPEEMASSLPALETPELPSLGTVVEPETQSPPAQDTLTMDQIAEASQTAQTIKPKLAKPAVSKKSVSLKKPLGQKSIAKKTVVAIKPKVVISPPALRRAG